MLHYSHTMTEANGNGLGDSKRKRGKDFSLHQHVQTDFGAQTASYTIGIGVSFHEC
jgi:hypothetical protein